jgi:hypothetical protein
VCPIIMLCKWHTEKDWDGEMVMVMVLGSHSLSLSLYACLLRNTCIICMSLCLLI